MVNVCCGRPETVHLCPTLTLHILESGVQRESVPHWVWWISLRWPWINQIVLKSHSCLKSGVDEDCIESPSEVGYLTVEMAVSTHLSIVGSSGWKTREPWIRCYLQCYCENQYHRHRYGPDLVESGKMVLSEKYTHKSAFRASRRSRR